MFDEIDFLVRETFKDAEGQKPARGFFDSFFRKDEKLPDEVPGFFYHLQKKASTFVIRIHACKNLKAEYKNILKHPNLYPALRLGEGEEEIEEKLCFFECDRFEIAQNIKAHLGNKRFPLFEEHIFNISDPGDSWWLKADGHHLKILFKLSHTEDISRLVKLGPLGDPERSQDVLNQLYGYFKMIFPVENYASAHSQWSISCEQSDNRNFNFLKELFITGEPNYDLWDFLMKLERENQDEKVRDSIQKANYFLMELAATRHFWKIIEEQL